MKLFKSQKNRTDHRLTLAEFVWYGFNFTCGITFVPAFYTWFNRTGQTKSLDLGYHMIWILIIEGIVAGTCAWAFSKLSRIHAPTDGAAYVYARTNLNPLVGWIVSICLYMTLPLVITSQIVSMIRINFIGGQFNADWGAFRNLYLDLIGIAIYGIASFGIFLGFKTWKRIFSKVVYVKWGLSVFLILGALILLIVNKGAGFQTTADHTNISASSFSSAFTSCFFFFLGFETFSTMNRNVKKADETIPLGLVLVMLVVSVVMVFVTIVFIGALANSGFSNNPAIQVWTILGTKANAKVIGTIGGILMIACFISVKASAGMANSLYSGSILSPIAKEGYIPEKFGEVSSDNLARKAIFLNIKVTTALLIFWLIIPDIIYGAVYGAQGANGHDTFTYTDFTSIVSVVDIIVYLIVIFIALKLSFEGKMKSNKIEIIAWILLFGFLVWQFIQFFIGIYHLYAPTDGSKKLVIKPTIQVVYFVCFIAGAFIYYFAYYAPKRKLRAKWFPKRHEELESQFHLYDDWNYTLKTITRELTKYIKRNKIIFENKEQKNLLLAKKIQEMMSEYERKAPPQKPDSLEKLETRALVHEEVD